jgi:hypothetical protein
MSAPPQKNAKNYQLWNHRRKCALALGPVAADRELSVADQALAEDEKNYHAWAHRQAIVKVCVCVCACMCVCVCVRYVEGNLWLQNHASLK